VAPGWAVVARSVAFHLAFWPWTAVMVLAVLPVLALPRQWTMAHARVWMRGVHALLRGIVGLDYEVRGQVPPGPLVFAVKHQSAWETMTLHLLIADPAIALKRELTQIPLFGWGLRRAGMIRIDRAQGARALRALLEGTRAALARGSQPVIFPEGTRVAPDERRPYQPGVAALYTKLNLPVVPVALNSGLFWPRRSWLRRPGRIVVEFLAPIPPGLERRAFMAELEARLEGGTTSLVVEGRARLAGRPA
jgi:1-acyl-sn-glycerol-3-phosphate acyltransferase